MDYLIIRKVWTFDCIFGKKQKLNYSKLYIFKSSETCYIQIIEHKYTIRKQMALFCSAGMWNVFLKMTLYILYVNKHTRLYNIKLSIFT